MNTDRSLQLFDARRLLARFDPETEHQAIAEALGVSVPTIRQWVRGCRIRLDPYKADRYALRLGLHPASVWGEQWWQAALQVA